MVIPVDRVAQVTAARCISCLQCVEVCPSVRAQPQALSWGPVVPRSRRWPQAVLIVILLLCTTAAVTASYLIPVPSFLKRRGTAPTVTTTATLEIDQLSCRGRANLFAYFLERDDFLALSGYLKIAAWPGPGWAKVQITYDPKECTKTAIQQAITEPYYDSVTDHWRQSPFGIRGYDPLALDDASLNLPLD